MTDRDGARVLALPPAAIVDRPIATLRDVDATLDPDAVWVLGPSREPQAFATARGVFDAPTFHPPLATGGGSITRQAIGECDATLATVQDARTLRTSPDAISEACADTDVAALVCDDVTTTIRPTALTTTLAESGALAASLPTKRMTTVLTGSLPAEYDVLWRLDPKTGTVRDVEHDPAVRTEDHRSRAAEDVVPVRVQGAGPIEDYGNAQSIAVLELTRGGVERTETYSVTDFGLEAVSGIGPKTAGRLAERGVTSRSELLETPVETLADLPNVGRSRAETMHHHARVLETGEPRRLTDESLPGENWHEPPLCLDIETDGLSPTIIWQIGVYDPATDDYRAFVERDDPSEPGDVLEACCDWLLGIHPNRALLTWNGWGFDYRHLTSFIARHVPYYAGEWESVPKLDLYLWAVRDDNAILPGRTNTLEDVAAALGYEDAAAATGIDGATTAAAYQRFVRTGTELDWDRHEAYCEDDCRALWHVYERLRDAPQGSDASASRSAPERPVADRGSNDERNTTENTASGGEQTGLGDFG